MKQLTYQENRRGCSILFFAAAIALMVLIGMYGGCGIEKTDGSKISDLEYELVEEEQIPEELKTKIEEKKAAGFKLTYERDRKSVG